MPVSYDDPAVQTHDVCPGQDGCFPAYLTGIGARRVFRTAWCLPVWVGGSGALLGPGEGDVEVGEDDPLGGGEPVEDGPGGSVGEVQVVEGGEDAATGGFGGAAFAEQAGQLGVGAEGAAQVGFDEAEDEQGDADDGDQRGDAVVVVQEDRADLEGLFEIAVALLHDPLVFVEAQHVQGGKRPVGVAG